MKQWRRLHLQTLFRWESGENNHDWKFQMQTFTTTRVVNSSLLTWYIYIYIYKLTILWQRRLNYYYLKNLIEYKILMFRLRCLSRQKDNAVWFVTTFMWSLNLLCKCLKITSKYMALKLKKGFGEKSTVWSARRREKKGSEMKAEILQEDLHWERINQSKLN